MDFEFLCCLIPELGHHEPIVNLGVDLL